MFAQALRTVNCDRFAWPDHDIIMLFSAFMTIHAGTVSNLFVSLRQIRQV